MKRHLKKCAPHLIKEKPGGPFKCPHPHCQRGLFTVRGWLTHKSSHTDLIHDCEYNNCTESFRSAAEIQNHVKTVHAHELQNFQCDYDNCSRSFPLKYLLDAHTDRHKRQTEHLCTECGKVCLTSCGLSAHMKNAHRYLKNSALCHNLQFISFLSVVFFSSNEKPFACRRCPQRFKQLSRLKSHMSVHTGIKEFQCHCGKLFSCKSGLKNHKREFLIKK